MDSINLDQVEIKSQNLHKVEMNPHNFFEIALHPNHNQKKESTSNNQEVIVTWKDLSVTWVPPKKFHIKSCFKAQTNPPPKQILNNVSGMAKPGELLAVMGGSGAGKTTLLNTLTMKHQKKLTTSGKVYINNQPLTSKMVASIAAFIQQDNLFIGTLTVKEQLIFQARLTMGNTTYTEKLKRVDEVMQELGLTKCKDTLIGIVGRIKGISGGEKRRLAVGCELLTDPRLLFCDEPTSGLDTSMAQSVVTMLQNLAMKGKTVICTIHQPSSEIYALFDKVLFLAEGRVAYLGSRDGALQYFDNLNLKCPNNYNPADFFIHTLAITADNKAEKLNTISKICNFFEKSDNNALMKQEIESTINNEKINSTDRIKTKRYKVPWIEQFRPVMWRSCLSVYKDPMLIKVRLLQSLLVGFLLGFFYYHPYTTSPNVNNINGAIFVLIINLTYQNLFAVIHVFSSELPVFTREYSSGLYGSGVYFFCKTLADGTNGVIECMRRTLLRRAASRHTNVPRKIIETVLAFRIAAPTHTMGINNSGAAIVDTMDVRQENLPRQFMPRQVMPRGVLVTASLIFILVANSASSFGYFISSISSSVQMALSVGPTCVVPLLLFGGFFLSKSTLPWYLTWIPHVSWFAYGFDSLLLNQWKGIKHIDCDVKSNSTCEKSGFEVLQRYNLESTELLPQIFELIALVVFIRLLAYLVFAIRAKIKS